MPCPEPLAFFLHTALGGHLWECASIRHLQEKLGLEGVDLLDEGSLGVLTCGVCFAFCFLERQPLFGRTRRVLAAQDWRQFSLLELRVFSREVFERL